MTRTQLGSRHLTLHLSLALVTGVVFTACCPDPPRPPEPDPGCRPGAPPSTEAELRACLRGQVFDSSREASDSQPLTVIEALPAPGMAKPAAQPCPDDTTRTCRFGPLAKIEPLKGAQTYSEAELREGRIIGRLSIPSGQREGYRKYGLEPGRVTYWWIQTDSKGTGGKSVFITLGQRGELKSLTRDLRRYLFEKGEELKRAITRWLWDLEDETAQGSCGAGTCR